MTASRIYPGTTVTLTTNVTQAGALTDAAAITFKWRHGNRGVETSITPTNTGTGVYTVSFIPLKTGNVYYRWDTEGTLNTAKEGTLAIADTQFRVSA